jgi:hypothetical protein
MTAFLRTFPRFIGNLEIENARHPPNRLNLAIGIPHTIEHTLASRVEPTVIRIAALLPQSSRSATTGWIRDARRAGAYAARAARD